MNTTGRHCEQDPAGGSPCKRWHSLPLSLSGTWLHWLAPPLLSQSDAHPKASAVEAVSSRQASRQAKFVVESSKQNAASTKIQLADIHPARLVLLPSIHFLATAGQVPARWKDEKRSNLTTQRSSPNSGPVVWMVDSVSRQSSRDWCQPRIQGRQVRC